MTTHDGALALGTIKCGVAAGHASVVLLVGDLWGQREPLAQRGFIEDAVAFAPESRLRAIGAGLRIAQRDVPGGQFAFQGFKVTTGFHCRLKLQVAPVGPPAGDDSGEAQQTLIIGNLPIHAIGSRVALLTSNPILIRV